MASAIHDRGRDLAVRVLRAGVVTGVADGLFATVQTLLNGATFSRLWQGVASVLLGPEALRGGTRTVVIGLAMHFGVALAWSAVFVLLVLRSSRVERVLAGPYGVIKVAAVYGPFVWMFMSLVVIPVLVRRPPNITSRWWVQLVGHFPFVGLPIVAMTRKQ